MTTLQYEGQVTKSGTKITLPAVFVIVVLTWAASAGTTYGIISTRLDWLSQRVESLEHSDNYNIKRPEYEAAKEDLANRLDRIERKIDALK